MLIWLDMYILDIEFGVSPHEVLESIKHLEDGEPETGIKPATQFKNLPLKGLWHKHFFAANFLVQNIVLGLGKNGLEKLVNEVMDPSKSPVITREMIEELAHRVTNDPLEKRNADKKMTGEWIVYIRHNGNNYYLCCNTHNAEDQFIFDRIMGICINDFPDLANWVSDARNSN